MDTIPMPLFLTGSVIAVVLAIEVGYRHGLASRKRSVAEKESPVSAISGSILALLAFMLAFTFGIVSNRYDARKALVRDEANAIGTAYLRTDFLPEPDRALATTLFREYVSQRLAAVQSHELDQVRKALMEAERIQQQLWQTAVDHARGDSHSEVAALYVESLNDVFDAHALRVAVGLQARIPTGIWMALFALMILGMLGVGYQTAIAGSRRSWSMLLMLAVSFSIVNLLIASLDRPTSRFITVSQQPLADLLTSMSDGMESGGR